MFSAAFSMALSGLEWAILLPGLPVVAGLDRPCFCPQLTLASALSSALSRTSAAPWWALLTGWPQKL